MSHHQTTFQFGKLIGLLILLRGLVQIFGGETLEFLWVILALPEIFWAGFTLFQSAIPGKVLPEPLSIVFRAYRRILVFQGLSWFLPLMFTAGRNPYHRFFSKPSFGAFLVGMGLYYFLLNLRLDSSRSADEPETSEAEFREAAERGFHKLCWLFGFILILNSAFNLGAPLLTCRIDSHHEVSANLHMGILTTTLVSKSGKTDGYLQQRMFVSKPQLLPDEPALRNPLAELPFFKHQSWYLGFLTLCFLGSILGRPSLVALFNLPATALFLSLALAAGDGKGDPVIALQTGFPFAFLAHLLLMLPVIPRLGGVALPVLSTTRRLSLTADPSRLALLLAIISFAGWWGIDYVNRDPIAVLIAASRSGSSERMEKAIEWFKQLPSNPERTSRLYQEALRENQEQLFEMLVKKGVPFDQKGVWAEPPLYWAVVWRHHRSASLLLEHGADPNLPCGYFATVPLHGVAEMGADARDAELVGLLLNKGARLEETDSRGNTPLAAAVGRGNTFMVEELLRRGARVDVEIEGKPLLPNAIKRGDKRIIELLMKAGASNTASPTASVAELTSAIQKGDVDVAKALIEKGSAIDSATATATSPLLEAIMKGNSETVALLLNSGADPNRLSGLERVAPLHHLAAQATREAMTMTDVLLKAKADPNLPDGQGRTPLQIAVFQGNTELARRLVAAGATTNGRFEKPRNDSFLHLAVIDNNLDLARLLLAHGAATDAVNLDGDTPLHLAVRGKSRELTILLLSQNSNPDTANSKGQTPRVMASESGIGDLFPSRKD